MLPALLVGRHIFSLRLLSVRVLHHIYTADVIELHGSIRRDISLDTKRYMEIKLFTVVASFVKERCVPWLALGLELK